MKWWKLVLILALLPKFASAVVIQQVLYDPISESGGEAVELYNPDSSAMDISGWAIATETSATDAVVPANTSIAAKGYYLIADKGWNSSKDNAKWRLADHEETITLTNTNAGVALIDANGKTVDAIGWGDKSKIDDGLYEGTPAKHVKQSRALLRQKDTGDNSKDFVDSVPDFFGKNTIKITVNVTGTNTSNVTILEDDDPRAGIQLVPKAGEIRKVTYSGGANQTFDLPYHLAPGNYTIEGAQFEVLPLKAFDIVKQRITLSATPGKKTTSKNSIVLKNLGNVDVKFSFDASDLVNGESKISIDYLSLVVDNEEQGLEDVVINPGKEKTVQFALFVPETASKGMYETMVYLTT